MEPFEESGLRFTPPCAACFRFADCATYRRINDELPEPCRTKQKLRLFFVLKVGAEGLSREALTPMKDKLANEIKAYADLLGIRSLVVLLLDHEGAIRKGLPVALVNSNA